MPEPVAIVEYDPQWPALFEAEKARLVAALLPYSLAVEHIGSTAVPGLASKATVDMMVGLLRLDDAPRCVPRLVALGFTYRPEFEAQFPERRYFARPGDGPEDFHVHMVEVSSTFWDRHLLFRDWLRSHAEDREAYAALKRTLAAKFGADRDGYAEAKTPFVRTIEEKAREELAKASELRLRRAAGAAPPLPPPDAPRPPSSRP